MSVALARQSFAGSSTLSIHGGMQFVGPTRISTGSLLSRAPSVYGGAGGFGTRVSQSTVSYISQVPLIQYGAGENVVVANEKLTMQNLNDRLGSYLDNVRLLEAANRNLELQIRQYYEKRATLLVSRDFTSFFDAINELRALIARRHLENQSIILQIDNAQLATEDFKMKLEMEVNMRSIAEADVLRLRGVRDNLAINISDLEIQLEGLREQLSQVKNIHHEGMQELRMQLKNSTVKVEVDSPDPVDLSKVLHELRQEYESLVLKNKLELEKWYQTKMDSLQTDIITFTTEAKTVSSQLAELKRSYQSLEINRQSIITEVQCLHQSLEEIKNRYSSQLGQLQATINKLEVELQQVKVSIEQQQAEYRLLLDIKMRLEMEIAEYRRLLDGDQKKPVVISKVVEEPKPVIERRVRTIVEELVDGKVVSSTVDTKVSDIK
ncbi:keratin, type I cytoskeletal 20-like [Aulostomus maculatus]